MLDTWALIGTPIRGRSCGGCQACCTQVPVTLQPDIHKPSNVRCPKLRSSGCGIYERRPTPCRAWSCRWLFDPLTAELKRPDHGHYIVDPQLDDMLANGTPAPLAQVWVDPAHPHAHTAPELRAYLAEIARLHGVPTIIRWASHAGFVLLPPALNGAGLFVEVMNSIMHSEEEMAARLAAARAGIEPPAEAPETAQVTFRCVGCLREIHSIQRADEVSDICITCAFQQGDRP